MKSLILIRHAKSSWENFSVRDFDRPLNDRGKRDAPKMAERMVNRNVVPDMILVSTAKRARKTAEHFIDAWKLKEDSVRFMEELYLASSPMFIRILSQLPPEVNSVAIVSHNNGLTDFANELTNTRIDNIPTCGIFAVKVNIEDWKQFVEAEKEFWFFDSPKNGS